MDRLLPCLEIYSDVETNSTLTPTAAQFAIIWLHGLGADGHDFEPIVPELKLHLPIRFIFPHAPEIPVTINSGAVMPAWYDIKAPQIETMEDEAGIRNSQRAVTALIEREIERGIESHKIILAGFSQGGAIALHTGLRYDKPLAGILGLSTYLPLAHTLENELSDANRKTLIKLAHGSYDQIVPIHLAEESKSNLDQLGYQTDFDAYPMEHGVCPEEVTAISHWIKQRLT